MKLKKILFGLLSLTVILNPAYVMAEELSITGNGDGSSSAINVTSSQTNEVAQNNDAKVENNVEVNANTGNNSANENTNGNTDISTGDINTNVEIINAGINQSSAEIGCCDNSNTNVSVSGNGSESNNSVAYSNSSNTNVIVNNNANINNSINGSANTGYNNANNNNGSVTIKTGSINVEDTIINRSINISDVNAKNGSGGSISIIVKGNGTDSQNAVIVENKNKILIAVNNNANISNESSWELNTGNNTSDNNIGEVAIETGDIVYKTTIINEDVNINVVDVDCCGNNNPEEPENPDPNPPSKPPVNGGNCCDNGGSGNGGTSSNGGTTGTILPITGGPSLLVLAVTTTIMFLLGWYLRLRSGRAPNIAR